MRFKVMRNYGMAWTSKCKVKFRLVIYTLCLTGMNIYFVTIYFTPKSSRNFHITMPAVTETLSECFVPYCGISRA